MRRNIFFFCGIAIVVIFVDQLTKWLIRNSFQLYESKELWGDFFRLTFIYNKNAAFGISFGANFPYAIVSIFIISLILIIFFTYARDSFWKSICFGLILGGACGNLTDRVLLGKVVDFFDVEFFDIKIPPFSILDINFSGYFLDRWPIFNIADSAITVAVIILFFITWFDQNEEELPSNKNLNT